MKPEVAHNTGEFVYDTKSNYISADVSRELIRIFYIVQIKSAGRSRNSRFFSVL